jgi:hypothetical protein
MTCKRIEGVDALCGCPDCCNVRNGKYINGISASTLPTRPASEFPPRSTLPESGEIGINQIKCCVPGCQNIFLTNRPTNKDASFTCRDHHRTEQDVFFQQFAHDRKLRGRDPIALEREDNPTILKFGEAIEDGQANQEQKANEAVAELEKRLRRKAAR